MSRQGLLIIVFGVSLGLASGSWAQDPGAQQDAEAAREKLLKASDQLDNIQANSEQTRVTMESMKVDIAKLQQDEQALRTENDALKAQVIALQAAFNQAEADHLKERQVLLAEVSKLIAANPGKVTAKKIDKDKVAEKPPEKQSLTNTPPTSSPPLTAPPADVVAKKPISSSNETPAPSSPVIMPTTPVQTGYNHIVASGETLTLIASAYRQQGVKVTVAEIRKANNLTSDSVLHIGEKLFIPKPASN